MSRPPARRPTPGERFLTTLGLALAVLAAVLGLTIVGGFIVVAVGMSHYGSNK